MERKRVHRRVGLSLGLVAIAILALLPVSAQKKEVVWSAEEKPLADQIHGLRSLSDDVRAETTKDLALNIRKLPATGNKLRLAVGLAGLSTEGDFGHGTLQEVATTLAETLRERPVPWAESKKADAGGGARATREPVYPYVELALLVRYEHVEAPVDLKTMTGNIARPWPGWRQMTASGNIRRLR